MTQHNPKTCRHDHDEDGKCIGYEAPSQGEEKKSIATVYKSKCCGKPVIYAYRKHNAPLKEGYFCGGANGCGNWCKTEVLTSNPSDIGSTLEDRMTAKSVDTLGMGVSAWENHGRKFGYWEYFVRLAKIEILENEDGELDEIRAKSEIRGAHRERDRIYKECEEQILAGIEIYGTDNHGLSSDELNVIINGKST